MMDPTKASNVAGKYDRVAGLAILLILMLATALLNGGERLLHRQLWMDEVHSWLLVSDADTTHAMKALADGVDFNPPGWFLTTRVLLLGTREPSELAMRSLSLCWMLMAFFGLYLLLARRFSVVTSVVAVLLTAAQPLLIHQSTELRFYGFWCAEIVWLCIVLQWTPGSRLPHSIRLSVLALLTLMVTITHYFGILSVALVAAPIVIRQFQSSDHELPIRNLQIQSDRRLLMAMISGCVLGAVICWMFLCGQKQALTRPTWISPPTIHDSGLFLIRMLPIQAAAIALVALFISRIMRPVSSTDIPELSAASRSTSFALTELAPCLCLALMPALIVLVSWTFQPTLMTRYAIVGLLATAPLTALIVERCHRIPKLLLLVCAMSVFGRSVSSCVQHWNAEESQRHALSEQVSHCPGNAVIVFEDRIQWMPLIHAKPDLQHRCFLLDFQEEELATESALRIVQRDVGRRIARWYPEYQLRTIDQFARHPVVCLVPYHGAATHVRSPAIAKFMPCTADILLVMKTESP
jgi:hypothetical protein